MTMPNSKENRMNSKTRKKSECTRVNEILQCKRKGQFVSECVRVEEGAQRRGGKGVISEICTLFFNFRFW
jgi:hypothetical protein